jgi:predicted hotdog family 3-hydroxylacyl-ACP dehydratase
MVQHLLITVQISMKAKQTYGGYSTSVVVDEICTAFQKI